MTEIAKFLWCDANDRMGRFNSDDCCDLDLADAHGGCENNDSAMVSSASTSISVDSNTVRREQPRENAVIRKEMLEIVENPRRFGYRRVGNMPERKGRSDSSYTARTSI